MNDGKCIDDEHTVNLTPVKVVISVIKSLQEQKLTVSSASFPTIFQWAALAEIQCKGPAAAQAHALCSSSGIPVTDLAAATSLLLQLLLRFPWNPGHHSQLLHAHDAALAACAARPPDSESAACSVDMGQYHSIAAAGWVATSEDALVWGAATAPALLQSLQHAGIVQQQDLADPKMPRSMSCQLWADVLRYLLDPATKGKRSIAAALFSNELQVHAVWRKAQQRVAQQQGVQQQKTQQGGGDMLCTLCDAVLSEVDTNQPAQDPTTAANTGGQHVASADHAAVGLPWWRNSECKQTCLPGVEPTNGLGSGTKPSVTLTVPTNGLEVLAALGHGGSRVTVAGDEKTVEHCCATHAACGVVEAVVDFPPWTMGARCVGVSMFELLCFGLLQYCGDVVDLALRRACAPDGMLHNWRPEGGLPNGHYKQRQTPACLGCAHVSHPHKLAKHPSISGSCSSGNSDTQAASRMLAYLQHLFRALFSDATTPSCLQQPHGSSCNRQQLGQCLVLLPVLTQQFASLRRVVAQQLAYSSATPCQFSSDVVGILRLCLAVQDDNT